MKGRGIVFCICMLVMASLIAPVFAGTSTFRDKINSPGPQPEPYMATIINVIPASPSSDPTPQIVYTHEGNPPYVQMYYTNNYGTTWNVWDTDATPVTSPRTFQTTTPLPASGTYYFNAKDPIEPVPSGAGSIEFGPWVLDITPPTITNTVPVNGATVVTLTQNIVITFSEAIWTSTFMFNCTPNPGGWSQLWSGGNTVVTLTHLNFEWNILYTCAVTGVTDMVGNPLLPGAVPNPWSFSTQWVLVMQVSDLVATPHQPTVNDIQLEWTNPTGATSFNIYRSTSVCGTGFNFSQPYATAIPGVGKTIWIDTGAYADASNYSWIVRSVGGYENTSVPTTGSNMAYKLRYDLFRGVGTTTPDLNYISLPYVINITDAGANVNNAAALRYDIRTYGTPTNGIASVARWNSNIGIWEIRTAAGVNFALTPGEAYRVAMAAGYNTCTYKIVGAYNASVITNLIRGTGSTTPDINYISLPYHYSISDGSNWNNAAALRYHIRTFGSPANGISSVSRWNSNTGIWEIRTAGGLNFPLTPGEGYRVAMAVGQYSVTWQCPVATPEP